MSLAKASLSGWHPEDVKAAVRKRGKTLSELSTDHGFGESYLRNALMRPLFDAEQIIATFIGVSAPVIWPDRYDVNGNADYRGWSDRRKSNFIALQKKAAQSRTGQKKAMRA